MTRATLIEHDLADRIILALERWKGGFGRPESGFPRPPVDPRDAASDADAAPPADAAYPAEGVEGGNLDTRDRLLAARLMRVNHAGEVAAQALYRGQSVFARDPDVRRALDAAAGEERAHLDWCHRRLSELSARRSRLDPAWWMGSFAIGAVAGAAGDAASLGFVAETERQVADHLARHLRRLPRHDARSRAILHRMREDERRHGTRAVEAGGRPLPAPVRLAMRVAAGVMTSTAYRI